MNPQIKNGPVGDDSLTGWMFLDFRPCLKLLHSEEVPYPAFVFQGLLFYIEQAFLFRQFFWICIFILLNKNFNKLLLSICF